MKHLVNVLLIMTASYGFSQSSVNFFDQYNAPRSFSLPDTTVEQSWDSLAVADGFLTIDITDTIAPVLSTQFGVNSTFRNGPQMATDGIRLPMYRKANLGTYRFPAGSGSNEYFWDGNIPSNFLISGVGPLNGQASNKLTPEQFTYFLDSVNGEATIVVNYFYARYGYTASGTRAARVSQAAGYAADWVRYMNITLGANIKHWEVGNECYGPWETGYDVNGSIVTGTEYGEDFRVFADSMKAADPTVKIGAVLHNNLNSAWNPQVLTEVHDHADFLVLHNYFTSFTPTPTDVLSSIDKVGIMSQGVRQQVANNTNKPSDHFPIGFTEFNSRGDHTITMTNGLFVAQVLGEIIKYNIGMSSLWVSEWGLNSDGWSHGFLTVNDPDQNDYTARPSYMPFYFYGKCFGDQMVSSTSSDPDIKLYASLFNGGELGLVVLNISGQEKKVNLDLGAMGTWSDAYWYEFFADSINVGNKRFYVNGQTSATPGGGPSNFNEIPMLRTSYDATKNFIARPWSANFIVISKDSISLSAGQTLPSIDLEVFPNPANEQLQISSSHVLTWVKMFDETGRLVFSHPGDLRSINTSAMPKGIYLFVALSELGIVSEQIFIN